VVGGVPVLAAERRAQPATERVTDQAEDRRRAGRVGSVRSGGSQQHGGACRGTEAKHRPTVDVLRHDGEVRRAASTIHLHTVDTEMLPSP